MRISAYEFIMLRHLELFILEDFQVWFWFGAGKTQNLGR